MTPTYRVFATVYKKKKNDKCPGGRISAVIKFKSTSGYGPVLVAILQKTTPPN